MSQQTTNRYFDELTSGLASGSISRGKALRLMDAALVGGTLASLGIGEAGADNLCKPDGKKCRKNAQCCSGKCEGGTCAAACTSDGGTCSTSSDCCSGNCSNGFRCASGRVGLSNGTCAKPCINGLVDCASCSGGCASSAVGVGDFCSNSAAFPVIPCSDHRDCPEGQFCRFRGSGDRCDVAC